MRAMARPKGKRKGKKAPNGSGSVWERPDGRWGAALSYPYYDPESIILWVRRVVRGAFSGPLTATVLQPERGPAHDMVPKAASIASTAESCMSGGTWE